MVHSYRQCGEEGATVNYPNLSPYFNWTHFT
jgi:hypothetical protein